MKHIAPCVDCKKRYPGCHGKCEPYAAWKAKAQTEKEKAQKEKAEDNLVRDYQATVTRKYRKKEKTSQEGVS